MTAEQFAELTDGLDQTTAVAKAISSKVLEFWRSMVDAGLPEPVANQLAIVFGQSILELMATNS